ncbi:Gfo/Idh/MocA family protein [Amycolatopsis pithecellobii]|uniref:Uncharacterized protein n=1 Tax=Amycolatopsis pithecellobii TaxID=664692 RepID=A0A6N7Z4W4_9PSEU|nr:Gfo/Idh/MocA family oxidoreductase [Amycolatopsis pithecellobii]MTD55484.1 hypothetical protein [Amycolatopsis pithecellobii]
MVKGPNHHVGLGVLGLGLAGRLVLESLHDNPLVTVVAGSDPREEARHKLTADYGARAYVSLSALCDDPEIDAVWVATPTALHRQHAEQVLSKGLAAVVEKPLAATVGDAQALVDLAARTETPLIAGGVRSLDPAFRHAREIIDSGRLGAVRAIQAHAVTDWMVRPREPAELAPERGGGLILNQAPHQIDTIRLLADGAPVRRVYARTGEWSPLRAGVGYYSAQLDFGDVSATLTYDGYGFWSAGELMPWASRERLQQTRAATGRYRKLLTADRGTDDRPHRDRLRLGTATPDSWPAGASGGHRRAEDWLPTDAGVVIVNCERGVLRQSARGLFVYDENGDLEEENVPPGDANTEAAAQLHAALVRGRPPRHDGQWGRDTLAAVVALASSGRTGHIVELDTPTHRAPAAEDTGEES